MIIKNLKNLSLLFASSMIFVTSLQAETLPEQQERAVVAETTLTRVEEEILDREFSQPEVAAKEDQGMENAVELMYNIDSQVRSFPGVFHYPVSISGNIVEMANGSVWEVNPRDTFKLTMWAINNDRLIFSQNSTTGVFQTFFNWLYPSPYKYRITNTITGDTVEASLKLGPFVDRVHQISVIDPVRREIRLSDGSLWSISSWDDAIYFDKVPGDLAQRRWIPTDCVIVGGNSEGSLYRPFILINVNVNKYCHAKLIY